MRLFTRSAGLAVALCCPLLAACAVDRSGLGVQGGDRPDASVAATESAPAECDAGRSAVGFTCHGGASCEADAPDGASFLGECTDPDTTCTVDCADTGECSVDCRREARCLLDCGDTEPGSCAIERCDGTRRNCDDVIVCNRPCPEED